MSLSIFNNFRKIVFFRGRYRPKGVPGLTGYKNGFADNIVFLWRSLHSKGLGADLDTSHCMVCTA